MSTRWVTTQILSLNRKTLSEQPPQPQRANPRRGQIQTGSTTSRVIEYLQQRTEAGAPWANHAQIVHATASSTKAVCWALIYLQALRMIQSTPDGRNPRYRRYRFARSESTG